MHTDAVAVSAGESCKVTVGLPVYNEEAFIVRCLDILLGQTFKDFELLISDNASTDRTFSVCQAYAADDRRIRLVRQKENIGAVNNFKFVARQARGEYFMWAAADDLWMPEFLERLVKALDEDSGLTVAMTAIDRVYEEDGKLYDALRFRGKDDPASKGYFAMMLGMSSVKKYNLFLYGLFRAEFLKKTLVVCYDVGSWDRVFMCQVALSGRFGYVDEMLYKKTMRVLPFTVRAPKEGFSKDVRSKNREFIFLKSVFRTVMNSKVIPAHRKMYVPFMLMRFLYSAQKNNIMLNIKKLFHGFLESR